MQLPAVKSRIIEPSSRRIERDAVNAESGMNHADDEPLTDEDAVNEAKRCLKCNLRLTITPPKFWTEY